MSHALPHRLSTTGLTAGRRSRQAPAGARSTTLTYSASASAGPAEELVLVATDVDGTLLDSRQRLLPRVIEAVQASEAAGVPVVIATGKAPAAPWVEAVLPALGRPRPGVYMQGLVILDAGGRTLYSRSLDAAATDAAQEWAAAQGHTLAAYCLPTGDGAGAGPATILSTADDDAARRLTFYGEPTPEGVSGSLAGAARARGLDVYKVIALLPPGESFAPEAWEGAQKALGGLGSLTSALPGMIELLPAGASKGEGLLRLTGELCVPPPATMFIGDGANDADALLLAGWGVAMANACEEAKVCADVVLDASNDEGGVADAIRRWVLEPRGVVGVAVV